MVYLQIIFAALLGIACGTITGIAPGIHINLVSAILLNFSGFLLSKFPPVAIAAFLVAIAITHTFVDFIPSIFLGAPSEDDNALSILPGHEMLSKGKGYQAVIYTLYGSLSALVIILIFSPIFFLFLPTIYPYAQRIMPLILLITSGFLIYFEKDSKVLAIIIFLLSGFLGLATLSLPMKEPLLPLFTGLFGVSSLITSLKKKKRLPKQKISSLKNIPISKKSFFKSTFASILASPLCSFLPGLGSGQAAVIGSNILGDLSRKEFLTLLGSINTIVTGLSFVTLYAIGKARTGIAVAVGKIIDITWSELWILTGVIFLAGILSFFITIQIAKIFSRNISKIDYRKLSLGVIIFLIIINFIFSSWLGLLVLAVSTCLGLACIYSGVRRTHMMGCLIIPALILLML